MSMINDALKRAKDAQKDAPPPVISEPPLQPADASRSFWRGLGLAMPLFLAFIALAGLFCVWLAAHKTKPALPPVATLSNSPPAVAATQVVALAAPVPTNAVAPPPAPAPSTNTAPETASESPAVTNLPAATPPPPPPLRVQAIFFNPPRSSVLIKGKSLEVGDSLESMRVTEISRESVTLVSESHTNVLTLSEH